VDCTYYLVLVLAVNGGESTCLGCHFDIDSGCGRGRYVGGSDSLGGDGRVFTQYSKYDGKEVQLIHVGPAGALKGSRVEFQECTSQRCELQPPALAFHDPC
jgi:hypothetical protein